MELLLDNITGAHKNKPCVVALHGPSLNNHKSQIENLQKSNSVLRISVNEWFNFFDEKPDYWVVSNGEFTIKASIRYNALWAHRQYPHDVFNKYNVPLLYNSGTDLTEDIFIKENLKCDYLKYDIRHFKRHNCKEILQNFRKYYEENKNLNFYHYGKNAQMWQRPDVHNFPDWYKNIHGHIAAHWDISGKCCKNKLDITLQEKLQELSGHSQHMGPSQTVGMFAVVFAVLMGCNPIFVSGLDLDCTLGYADTNGTPIQGFNAGNVGHWKVSFRDFLTDDMRILDESAKLLGVKIINLNKEAWYNEFHKGELEL
jgi:hypothetical protein